MRPKKFGREISCLKNLFSRNVENNETVRFVNEVTSANVAILGFLAKNQNQDIYQKHLKKEAINTVQILYIQKLQSMIIQ